MEAEVKTPTPRARAAAAAGENLPQLTRRFGQFLGGFYLTTTISAAINLTAVLLGFWLAYSWEARDSNLREMRTLLSILRPLHSEVVALTERVQSLQVNRECRIPAEFKAPIWRSIDKTERALFLGDLYAPISEAHERLVSVVDERENLTEGGCRAVLGKIVEDFDRLRTRLHGRLLALEKDYETLSRSQALGLRAFIRDTLGVTPVVVLLLPFALYGLMLAATRARKTPRDESATTRHTRPDDPH
jgi:hypothetical protein